MLINSIEIQDWKLIILKKNFVNWTLDDMDLIKDTIWIKDWNFILEKTEIIDSKRWEKNNLNGEKKEEKIEKIKKVVSIDAETTNKFSID